MIRDGALPAILLCLALGLALARVPRRYWLTLMALTFVAALGAGAVVLPASAATPVAIGAALVTMLCAVLVYRGKSLGYVAALILAAGAGAIIGALAGLTGELLVFLTPLFAAIALPAGWAVERDRAIVIKVLASWLLAVAMLSAGLNAVQQSNAGSDHLD